MIHYCTPFLLRQPDAIFSNKAICFTLLLNFIFERATLVRVGREVSPKIWLDSFLS